MTLIAALKTRERIVVMSDTAISDRDAIRADLIPGRLKSVVLGPKTTVSYAGLSAQALNAIRHLHRNKFEDDEAATDHLLRTCQEFPGAIEFLFCSHNEQGQSRLMKITSDGKAEGARTYWIGNGEAARSLSKSELHVPPVSNLPEYISQEEVEFTSRFSKFLERHSDFVVGGAAITCVCSQNGHAYQNEAGATMLTPIQFPDPVAPEIRAAEARTGMSRFSYHIYSAQERGVAVVGYYLEQAEIGFLHIPLVHDDALKVEARDQEVFRQIVVDAGRSPHGI